MFNNEPMKNTVASPITKNELQGSRTGFSNYSWASFMTKKFFIAFLICILCFIVSEYYLLQEVYTSKRSSILLFSSLGILGSLAFFWFFYKKYRKVAK
jgi:hypothetical protein